ncbi:M16 family metallopeptidase [Blattabacterium cuenoti]|uniref:M16 family metallopeptidase n=1 Tax=Blattabacterium cuenoti TaxID=1653831 RepID=UPI001EEBE9F7|nr:pitrilysin family protein [Blattabacterium cuenoti]
MLEKKNKIHRMQIQSNIKHNNQKNISINWKDPDFFSMKNGLKILVIEHTKLPLVRVSAELEYIPFLEQEKTGIKNIFGTMLRAGSLHYSKEQLENIVDYLGIDLYTYFHESSIFTMKKYLQKSLHILSDILIHSKFDNYKEFNKIVKQRNATIRLSDKEPNCILQKISNLCFYGKNHPYGESETIDTIKNITIHDLKKLHEKYYVPNNFYLSFVGDISKKEAQNLCNEFFSEWKKKIYQYEPIPKFSLNNKPSQFEVNVIDFPFVNQSYICIGKPVNLEKSDSDYIPSILANGILGEGPQSRLFSIIREEKGFTYDIHSSLESDQYIGKFSVITTVGYDVTYEAVKTIISEIKKLVDKQVSKEELDIKKKEIIGQFILNLEYPERIQDLFICELKNNLPSGFFKNYLNKVESVTEKDIHRSCKKFFDMKNGRMFILGNMKKILHFIKKLGYPIRYFDRNGTLLKKEK